MWNIIHVFLVSFYIEAVLRRSNMKPFRAEYVDVMFQFNFFLLTLSYAVLFVYVNVHNITEVNIHL
jgi:hypothetical protein